MGLPAKRALFISITAGTSLLCYKQLKIFYWSRRIPLLLDELAVESGLSQRRVAIANLSSQLLCMAANHFEVKESV